MDYPSNNGECGVLKVSAVAKGVFLPGKNKAIREMDIEKARENPKAGSIIISRANTSELVGACGYVECDYNNLFLSDKLWQTEFDPENKCCPKWLNTILQLPRKRHEISVRATGTSGSMKNISQSSFLTIQIAIPSLPEQKKIAKILYTWDTAFNQIRKLISAKKNHKKALMNQLLSGKKRLLDSKKPWNEYYLGDLFKERRESNGDHLPLLAITGNRGVIPASEIDRKDSSSADKSKYKRIVPGDIGYNTMRMWQGVSAVSDFEGIVSPAYTICKPKKNVNVIFMGYLFKFPHTVHLFCRYSQGLVSDTLNLKFHHFAQIKIKIPDIKEQNAIARFLSTIDSEITSHEKKLSALKRQKRGLMQKLLTGEVRVNT